MKIQSDNLSPYIQYNNLTLRPDIHNNYAVTVFKPNEEVTVELINNQAKVSTNQITEYWNIETMHTVNDQITDAVTVTETNQSDTFIINDSVNIADTSLTEPSVNNTVVVDDELVEDNTVNLNDSIKTAKVLEN